MSFISRLKHTLGFTPDDLNEDLDNYADPQAPAEQHQAMNQPATTAEGQMSGVTVSAETDSHSTDIAGELAPAVFTAVVEYFNTTQPEFVARHLDTEAQKEFLLNAMSEDVKRMLLEAVERAEREARERDSAERRKLNDSMSEMRKQCERLEQLRDKLKNDQLSSTRQKRALNDRVHDLEAQLESMTAEREQLTLENRSMANRLRVMGLTGDKGDEAVAEELLKATDELNRTKAQAEEQTNRIKELEAKVTDHDSLTAKCDDLTQKLQAATAEIEQLKAAEHPVPEAALQAVRAEEEERYRQKEEALKARLTTAERERDRSRSELQMARADVEKLDAKAEELRRQLNNSTSGDNTKALKKAQAKVSDLSQQLSRAEGALTEAQAEIRTLTDTISTERARHQSESEILNEQIRDLRRKRRGPAGNRKKNQNPELTDEIPGTDDEAPAETRHPRLSAIDELIDSSEWLVAPTPEQAASKVPEPDNPDFGYKAPAHKVQPDDDDKQLLLF